MPKSSKPRNTIRITDIDALAAYEGGKFVDTAVVTATKHTPKRDMIKAALKLGYDVPGVEQNTEAPLSASVGGVAVPVGRTPSEIRKTPMQHAKDIND